VQIDLNDLKMMISISVTKNAPDICSCSYKRGRKDELHKNISINLYYIDFFIVIKKITKNQQELWHL